MTTTTSQLDPHASLRALYMSLLTHQGHFDEFKQLLALYEAKPDLCGEESARAAEVREQLNETIRCWVGDRRFAGLSAAQVLQWRAIVVEDRLNVSLSPWKESNWY